MSEQRAITEREVRRLARDGAKIIDVRGAIVTPGARSAARELGVILTGSETPTSVLPIRAYGAFDPRPFVPSTVALACDQSGTMIKEAVAARLYQLQHTVTDLVGPEKSLLETTAAAVLVAREVSSGRARFGVVVDGTGVSACIAANKIKGVRAALCHDVTTAVSAREHSDANVLALAGSLIGPRLATAIVETFLTRDFVPERYAARLEKLKELDEQR